MLHALLKAYEAQSALNANELRRLAKVRRAAIYGLMSAAVAYLGAILIRLWSV